MIGMAKRFDQFFGDPRLFESEYDKINELYWQRLEQLYSEAEKLGKTVRPSHILETFFGALFDLAKEPGGEHSASFGADAHRPFSVCAPRVRC